MRRCFQYILCVVVLTLLASDRAEAHAVLVRSVPVPGAVLTAAPRTVLLEFNEELDAGFSTIRLVDRQQQIVAAGPGVIDPQTPKELRLAFDPLPAGSYTAIWRVRSAVDGHITDGHLPFAVGADTVAALPAAAPADAALAPPPLRDSVVRWLNLLFVMLALGSVPFGVFVWQPAVTGSIGTHQSVSAEVRTAHASMVWVLRKLVFVGGILLLLATLLLLVTQAASAADVPWMAAIGAPTMQLLSSRTGVLLLARVVLTLGVMAVVWRLPLVGRRWWPALLLGGALLLTFSLNSHSAAVDSGAGVAIAMDWLHIVAMVVWMGGLVPLIFAVWPARHAAEHSPPLGTLLSYFSRLAISGVVVLALTGVYSYMLHINNLDVLASTTYGRALVIKTVLFGTLLLLGGLNMLFLAPRLRLAGEHIVRALGRSVQVELVVGVLLLLAVGAMTSVAPGNAIREAAGQPEIVQQAAVGAVELVLRIAPAANGDSTFVIDVHDPRPGAANAPSKVVLRFHARAMDMGALQTEAAPVTPQQFETHGSYLSMDGPWAIDVVLRRAGLEDVQHTFNVQVDRDR